MSSSLLAALQAAPGIAKTIGAFDQFLSSRRGNQRALIDELNTNTNLCQFVVAKKVPAATVIADFKTQEFDRLNKEGFGFDSLKRAKIEDYPEIKGTSLASYAGKPTSELITRTYELIKKAQLIVKYTPADPLLGRRVMNISKRLRLLARHIGQR